MTAGKMNNSFTHSLILGNGGESKSYNDDDKRWNTSTSTRAAYHTRRRRRPSSRKGERGSMNPSGNWRRILNEKTGHLLGGSTKNPTPRVSNRVRFVSPSRVKPLFNSIPSRVLNCSSMNTFTFKTKYTNLNPEHDGGLV